MSLIKQINILTKVRYITVKNCFRAFSAQGVTLSYETDPRPMFTDSETQKLLKSITQLQLDKIFRKRAVKNNSAEYKFMTTEDLEEEFRNSIEKAKKKIEMPPVVKIKEEKDKIISEDKALKGFSDTKFVFTDITFGKRNSDRAVVVRDTDGTLRYAPMDITKRVKQLYVPLEGRNILTPKMFEDEHFQRCLDEHKYEFILDRLLVQYDPYELDYHRLTAKVYQHISETKEFDQLRSTRHFGPMAFFYAWHKAIDDLLYDMIRRDYLRNGAELVALYYKIHKSPENYSELLSKLDQYISLEDLAFKKLRSKIKSSANDGIHEEIESAIGKTADDFELDALCLEFIEKYVATYALKKVQLELSIQTLKEINSEKKQLFDGLRKAHGV